MLLTRSGITLLVACLMALCLSSSPAIAHTPLTASQPAAGAQLAAAPESLLLEFGGQVNLLRLKLSHEAEGEITVDFKPSRQTAQQFSVPLPELKAGNYSLQWAAIGEDGHMVQGTIPFSINSP